MTRADARRGRQRPALRFLGEVLAIMVIAVLVAVLLKAFVIRSFFIPSESMEDTLQVGDRVLVDELTPHWTGYAGGDIVVFRDPGGWLDPVPRVDAGPLATAWEWVLGLIGMSQMDSDDHLVKRVIGVAGDRVVCCDAEGRITVDGEPLDESSHVKLPAGETAVSAIPFDVTVPDGALWVLGDNRYDSRDARYHMDEPGHGFVPLEDVVGRVFLRTMPLDRFGDLG